MDIPELEKIARQLRSRILKNAFVNRVPHIGSCFSCVEILVALYYAVMHVNPKKPNNPKRDRFVLSKGHAVPALYQILAMQGFFPEDWLNDYGQNGSYFGEHPAAHGVPGIDTATGSLGHGLSIAAGLALGQKLKKYPSKTYALLGDGECDEGEIWEAALFASQHKLSQLVAIIDYNHFQAIGQTNQIMNLEPLADKWRAFGWEVRESDGHDFTHLLSILQTSTPTHKPTVIIAHTIKGKGISFIENDNNWHYKLPTKEDITLANKELDIS